jgi:hypothetical protein
LEDDFGLLLEYQYYGGVFFITLIFLDLHAQTLQKLTTIEYPCKLATISVNKADPTQFLLKSVLNGEWSMQLFKVKKTEIIPGEIIDRLVSCSHFYDGCIYGFNWIRNEDGTMVRYLPNV